MHREQSEPFNKAWHFCHAFSSVVILLFRQNRAMNHSPSHQAQIFARWQPPAKTKLVRSRPRLRLELLYQVAGNDQLDLDHACDITTAYSGASLGTQFG